MKKILPIIIVIIIVGAGAFYGGMKYGENKIFAQRTSFQNLSPEQRQQFAQGTGRINARTGGNFVSGEVTTKDDKSFTIKLPNGSSKIIFLYSSTEISKFVSGTLNDLEVGKTVVVNGTTNQDGSITAKSIQIR